MTWDNSKRAKATSFRRQYQQTHDLLVGKKTLRLHRGGLSLRQIAAVLDEEQLKRPGYGKRGWQATQVMRILKRLIGKEKRKTQDKKKIETDLRVQAAQRRSVAVE